MAQLHLPAATVGFSDTAFAGVPTMSSREIADLCGARHNDVAATIERLFASGVLRESRKTPREYRPDGGGRPTAVYDLTKRDTLVVVSGYNDDVRARIIDRWMELEASDGRASPGSFSEALQLAADQARQIEQQNAVLVAQQPKVEFYDQFVSAEGLLGYQEAGTAAGCFPNKFCNWLKIDHLFYRGKKLMPRSQYVRRGLFEIRPELDTNGESHLRGWVTAKGVEFFAKHAPDSIRITHREVKP